MWKRSLTNFCFLIFLRFISCCQCNSNHSSQTYLNIGKRQIEFEDYITTEFIDNATETTMVETSTVTVQHKSLELNDTTIETKESITTEISEINIEAKEKHLKTKENITESSSELNENGSDLSESIMEGTETNVELNESLTADNETTKEVVNRRNMKTVKHSQRDLTKKCRHFKKGNAFDLGKMADVWQVVYYQLPNKLKCFKLHIKLVKFKEQQRYATVFGNFNDTVHWEKCFLEIKSTEKSVGGARRHFLQGAHSDQGVMENVIIDEEHCQNTTYLTLHRESGDQWLVIKNLLLMRDCETGDLVVFSRVPLQPHRDDILDALMIFGENKPNGTMACEE